MNQSLAAHNLPVASPDEVALGDLQLVLSGVELPFSALGGSTGPALEPGHASVVVSADLAPSVLHARGLLLVDREGTPVAQLDDTSVTEVGPSDVLATGRLVRLRPSEAMFGLHLNRKPSELPPSVRRRVVIAARPPLQDDAIAIEPEADADVVVLVPVGSATPDGVPPHILLATYRATLAEARGVHLVTVPIAWRDPVADKTLSHAVAAAYGASEIHLLECTDPAWQRTLSQLREGRSTPNQLAPDVAASLLYWQPPRSRRGLVVFFTGLSGSGKSTLSRAVVEHVRRHTARTVSLLDGDDVRRLLSSELGFDPASRDLNVRRIGFVASEIARHDGMAVCAPIAPYARSRAAARFMAERVGADFILVHVATPLSVCEARDLKGLYAKARAGILPAFTGVSDPYEVPQDADLTVDTSTATRETALAAVLEHLYGGGWLGPLEES